MLARLLSRGARREETETVEVEAAPAPKAAIAAKDALLLFVPWEGGMSYSLFAVPDEQSAVAFLQQEFPRVGGKPLLFEPIGEFARLIEGEEAEFLVVINDPSRPGIVYLSSFTDMESAQSFVRFEERNGLDSSLVTIHRGVPRSLESAVTSVPSPLARVDKPRTPQSPAVPRPAAPTPAPTQPVAQSTPVATTRLQPAAPVQPARVQPARVQPVVTSRGGLVAATPMGPTAAAQTAGAAARPGIIQEIKQWPGWDTLVARVQAACKMEWQVYEDIKDDPLSAGQARIIVAAGALAAGIGIFWGGPIAIVMYIVAAAAGWLAGAHLTYWVGTNVFPGRRSPETKQLLLKGIAFAHAPRIFLVIGLIPFVSVFMPLFVLGVSLWALAAMVPPTQYALELDKESAMLTAIIAWVGLFAISFILPAILV